MSGLARRGRSADRPTQIDRRGWRDILIRTKNEAVADHVSMIGAGVAFYGLLALFPAIAATLSIWGLAFDSQQLEQQIETLAQFLPEQAAGLVRQQVNQVTNHLGGLSIAAMGGIGLALYSASKGIKALIEGLNITYDEEEKRGFIKLNLVAFALTLMSIVALLVAIGLVIVVPALLGHLGQGPILQTAISLVRWPILIVGAMIMLALLYRFGPSRENPKWRWVTWGAAIATLIWVAVSIGFSIYVNNFSTYNRTYGSIGAVIILLTWLWLSACLALLGAEINAEMEHQTKHDSTTGRPRRLGERGAHVADDVGEVPQ